MIKQAFREFKKQVQFKDPEAEVILYQPAIKQLVGSHNQPIADLQVITGGVEYRYSLLQDPFTGAFLTVPFVNQ